MRREGKEGGEMGEELAVGEAGREKLEREGKGLKERVEREGRREEANVRER